MSLSYIDLCLRPILEMKDPDLTSNTRLDGSRRGPGSGLDLTIRERANGSRESILACQMWLAGRY